MVKRMPFALPPHHPIYCGWQRGVMWTRHIRGKHSSTNLGLWKNHFQSRSYSSSLPHTHHHQPPTLPPLSLLCPFWFFYCVPSQVGGWYSNTVFLLNNDLECANGTSYTGIPSLSSYASSILRMHDERENFFTQTAI